jgi:hypothetical protein
MGSYNPELQELVGVDQVEIFIDGLTEYQFPSDLPDEEYTYRFYDAGGRDLPYTLQVVLEHYYRLGRAVKVTVEDAGPTNTEAVERAQQAADARQRALVALEGEARHRARARHQEKY